MKPVVLLTCLLFAAPKTPVNDAAGKYDVAELKARLKLLTDGKGHFVAFDPGGSFKGPFFYGDGKTFNSLRAHGGSAVGTERFSVNLWDPREIYGHASIEFADNKYSASCEDRTAVYTLVPEAEAKKLLDVAEFFKARWQRREHKLARDDKGTYYFVDCARDDERSPVCERDWRLYVGARGKLKLQEMTNIVSDSVGQIFSTRSGELRLVLNEEPTESGKAKAMKWVAGKTETKLIDVPVADNGKMIFTDLGVYDRERLGTPCDDL